MLNLSNIQKSFQNAVLSDEASAPDFFISTEKVSAETRLEIYSEAYRWRLVECLEANYPVLSRYLGDENFSALALGYVDEYPSEYRNVRWFGDRLAEFIADTEEFSDNPFVIELAKLEWILSLVFDAKEAPILAFSDFATISPEKWPNLILQFHPSVHRLNIAWNTVEIWEALMQEAEEYPEPVMLETQEPWIFWRKDLEISFCAMPILEAKILDFSKDGKNWQTLCESLLPSMNEEEIPNFIAPLLGKWLQSGLISFFLIKP